MQTSNYWVCMEEVIPVCGMLHTFFKYNLPMTGFNKNYLSTCRPLHCLLPVAKYQCYVVCTEA